MRTVLILALLAGGCVGKQKYLDLEAAHAQSLVELEQVRTDRNELREDVVTASEQLAALERDLEAKKSQLAALEKQLTEERGEKAELLKTRAKLNASISEMTKALDELAARKSQAEARVADFRDLITRFQSLIDSGRLQVRIIDGRMVVQLATDILFSSGSASLSAEGREAVREVAKIFTEIPERSFQVEGHTDDVPIRTDRFPSNWELASARALTVVREMLDAGLSPGRVSAASYAEYAPVAPNRTAEGKALNRRIQIVIVPDLDGLPGFEELQEIASDD